MTTIRSYVVRYDSGFAPNPFYGYCTLSTCVPKIREASQIGDWVVGSGSDDRSIRHGGHLVYAMRVEEILTFGEYDVDPRFDLKKPYRRGSRKQSCGDNIYYRDAADQRWLQRDSFHSNIDGSRHSKHVSIDTRIDRVLVSQDFVYFGGVGPAFPAYLKDDGGRPLCKSGRGHSRFDEARLIAAFEGWIRGLGLHGFQGAPFEWISLRAK